MLLPKQSVERSPQNLGRERLLERRPFVCHFVRLGVLVLKVDRTEAAVAGLFQWLQLSDAVCIETASPIFWPTPSKRIYQQTEE